MRIRKLFGVQGAKQAKGITVIIDVYRAATTTAFLLDKGIKEIIPVSTKAEAFAYKNKNPSCVLIGEEMGFKINGFDYGNSPYEINKTKNLRGKTVIFRTSMGTQGVVHAKNATEIILASFVTVSPIVQHLKDQDSQEVSIVSMDTTGTEDDIFADYLIAKLRGEKPENMENIISYLKTHPNSQRFLDPKIKEFYEQDFYLSLDLDRFDFFPLLRNGKIIKYG